MSPGRASYSNTPATDSMSMPPGRVSHSCHRLYKHASGSGEPLPSPTLRACLRVGRATPTLPPLTLRARLRDGQGNRIKPLPVARPANTRCYSCKGEHESSMMIVKHHGQPGRSHEH
eukprot:2171522-Rhodomonas_salina.1